MIPEPSPTPVKFCVRCGKPEVRWDDVSFCPGCMKSVACPQPLGRLGPYVLESPLGEGGMGHVYLAFHEQTGRAVAVKTPRTVGRERDTLLRRFVQEARALSALDHPGILPIYEVGEAGGEPWFAMKLAEGGTMADLLEQSPGGRLPEKRAASLLADIAAALSYAHEHGVLHRDLKPQNILLDERGLPMLGDFGLAKWEGQSHEHFSQTLMAVGTPDYAAPELAQGLAPSAAADIFSLGAVLYQLLAGAPPFRAGTVEATMVLAKEGRAEPLDRQGVAPDLWQICRKCLEPEPVDRYATAAALERDLRSWLRGEPVSVRRLSPTEKLRRVVRRNPMVTVLSLTTALVLVAAMALVILADRRVLRTERQMRLAATRLADEQMHLERLAHVDLQLSSGRSGQRAGALRILREEWIKKPGPVLRSLAVRALTSADFAGLNPASLGETDFDAPDVPRVVAAPSGGLKAVVVGSRSQRDGVRIQDEEGNIKAALVLDGDVAAMQWNATGDALALACSAKGAYLWRAGLDRLAGRISPRDSVTTAFGWHPGGRFIACMSAEGALWLWDLESSEEVVTELYGITGAQAPLWCDDGRALAWTSKAGGESKVRVIFPEGVRFLRTGFSGPRRENFPTLALQADRGLALWVVEDGVYAWDLARRSFGRVVEKSGTEWMGARFTVQGIETCGWNSGLRGLSFDDLQQGKSLPAAGGRAPYVGMVLLEAGTSGQLALLERPANRFVLLSEARQGEVPPRIHLSHPEPYAIALGRSGDVAVTSSFRQKEVKLWALEGPRMTREFVAEESACAPVLSPAGDRVLLLGRRTLSWWAPLHGRRLFTQQNLEAFRMGSFSPDGKLLALQNAAGTQLFQVGDEGLTLLTKLTNPSLRQGDGHVSLAFDSQRPQLGEQLSDGSVIVWDLQVIEAKLRALGMGW